jgi:hypothetical protein
LAQGRADRSGMTKEREPDPEGWVMARRFPDPVGALKIYEAARDLLLKEDLDASAFRFFLDGENYVAIVGEAPLPSKAARKLHEALRSGQEVGQLPASVVEHFRERRREFKGLGVEFLERRTGLV